MSNVLDTLPSITQADAEIYSVAESDSREVEKVDDRTNRHPSSAPIPLGRSLPEIAEEDTWYKDPFISKSPSRYYEYDYTVGTFLTLQRLMPKILSVCLIRSEPGVRLWNFKHQQTIFSKWRNLGLI